jgi:hypothetical protein
MPQKTQLSMSFSGHTSKRAYGSSYGSTSNSYGATSTSTTTTTTTTAANIFPWTNGNREIKAYCYWEYNFQGNGSVTYLSYVSQPQTIVEGSGSTNSNSVSATTNYTYSSTIPSGMNCVVLFSGYSICSQAISNTSSQLSAAQAYFSGSTDPWLISLSFGGGNSSGGFYTGTGGAIYSIYQAVTKSGVYFSYTETRTGASLSGTGTGTLTNVYNSLFFDIEVGSSSGQDFLNLFKYIKTNTNSNFYSYECIIIVSVAHSCSNYSSNTFNDISTIYSDPSGSYDYMQNQLYTQNIGKTNEYAGNYNILWNNATSYTSNDSVEYFLSKNANYIKYGLNMLLPAINFANLYTTGGTTTYPNLYFYQASSNSSPLDEEVSGSRVINYTTDTGALGFYNAILSKSSTTLGGYMQWVNGTVS